MPTRSSARKIASSISTLAARDLLDESDDDYEMTLIDLDPLGATPDEDEDGENDGNDEDDEDEDENEDSEEEQNLESLTNRREVSDDEDDDEEEDDEDEVVIVPLKRKRGKGKKSNEEKAPAQPRQIEYTTSIYTPEQLTKSKSSRGPPESDIFSFISSEAWSTVKSRIRKNIRSALNLNGSIDLDDYRISFTVPRQVKDPIVLNDSTKYDQLVSNALKIKTHPAAKILVEPKAAANTAEKENDDKTDGKKGGKKTKVPHARDILPGNVALNDKIAAIRERWKCPTQGRQCGSEHCFVRPDEPEHYPLSHAQCESWGAAMLKGDEFATINKPPNNELFDKLDPRALAARSPLLQRRLELNQQKAAAATPQININFPPELVGLFGRPAAPPPEPAVAAVPVIHRAAPAPPDVAMLIPPGVAAGPSLSVEEFCAQYELDDDICTRFTQFKYKKTDSFRYIALHQLEKMEFMAGEVAEIQVAIAKWSVPIV